jgi:predicted nucleic acid-binding protein
VLDTDIVVDALRDFTLAIDYLEDVEQQGDLRISRPTQMELLVGCRNRAELQRLERFLRRFTMLDLTESIGQSAVALLRQYRLSHGLLIIDALCSDSPCPWGNALYEECAPLPHDPRLTSDTAILQDALCRRLVLSQRCARVGFTCPHIFWRVTHGLLYGQRGLRPGDEGDLQPGPLLQLWRYTGPWR